MLLTASQILAAGDRKTVEVDVPEWGEGAKVLVGSVGAMAKARLQDWIDTHGRTPQPAETQIETDEEPISCDTPQPDAQDEPARQAPKQYSRSEDMEIALLWCIESILDPATKEQAFILSQLEALGQKNPAPLFRICGKAMELSLATDESSAAFEKNSGRTAG